MTMDHYLEASAAAATGLALFNLDAGCCYHWHDPLDVGFFFQQKKKKFNFFFNKKKILTFFFPTNFFFLTEKKKF